MPFLIELPRRSPACDRTSRRRGLSANSVRRRGGSDEDRGVGERHLRRDDNAVVVRVCCTYAFAPQPEEWVARRVVLRAAVAGEDRRDALAEGQDAVLGRRAGERDVESDLRTVDELLIQWSARAPGLRVEPMFSSSVLIAPPSDGASGALMSASFVFLL